MKQDFLYRALEKLQSQTGLIATNTEDILSSLAHPFDAQFDLRKGLIISKWVAIIKQQISKATIAKLIEQKSEAAKLGHNNFIVVAEYIAPGAKQVLIANHIAFLDVAGNANIDHPQFYIHNNTGKSISPNKHSPNRAFTKAGLKVVFYMLIIDGLINQSYRTIARHSGTGLDTINKVFKALLAQRYLIKINKSQYKLNNKEKLIQNWVEAYNSKLRPSLFLRRYRSAPEALDWSMISLHSSKDKWGGAIGADILTQHLVANTWLLYTEDSSGEISKRLKWVPDQTGYISVYRKFWKSVDDQQPAPPLIIYADLLASNDPRYIETAQIIYSKYLKNES